MHPADGMAAPLILVTVATLAAGQAARLLRRWWRHARAETLRVRGARQQVDADGSWSRTTRTT